nr:MAG TPA: hypothetical protein [Caudoviricetes sp.]
MTNSEYLETLTDEEKFIRMMMVWYSCEYCVGQGDYKKCLKQQTCLDGRLKRLMQEHKENVTK